METGYLIEPLGWGYANHYLCNAALEKIIPAQLGIEPRSPTLCLKPAGQYIVGIIPLDHCTFLSVLPMAGNFVSTFSWLKVQFLWAAALHVSLTP